MGSLRLVIFAWLLFASARAELVIPPEMKLAALPAKAPEPSDNPGNPAKERLGEALFFDPILSASRTVACATCHHPKYGFADGRATPLGVGGKGLGPARRLTGLAGLKPLARNTPSLINVAFNGLLAGQPLDPTKSPMFWDARVQGLEAQVLHPLRAADEMHGPADGRTESMIAAVERVRAIPEYRRWFEAAFPETPGEPVTALRLTRALAAFERGLKASDTRFDRHLRGEGVALTEAEQRGMKVFTSAGCILCHGGPMFSDFKPHFIGVSDSGPDGRSALRTPTLRQLRDTAPYMHNGSQRTLEEVLNFYERLSDAVSETLDGGDQAADPPLDPLLQRLDLAAEQFDDLTAFLNTLNDDTFQWEAPTRVPSGLPVGGEIHDLKP